MSAETEQALSGVLDLIAEWQQAGRTGHCMPVIRSGELLALLESLTDERRRDNCSWCDGTGTLKDYEDRWPCRHCEPMKPEEK